MVEIKHWNMPTPDLLSQPEQGAQHQLETMLARDRRDDLEELALALQAVMLAMPSIELRAEASPASMFRCLSASVDHINPDAMGSAAEDSADSQVPSSLRHQSTRADMSVMQRAASAMPPMPLEAPANFVPALGGLPTPALPISMPQELLVAHDNLNANKTVADDVHLLAERAARLAESRTNQQAGDKRADPSLLGQPPQKELMPAESRSSVQSVVPKKSAQGMPVTVSFNGSASAQDGWTYNFRSWGNQHAVKISTQPGSLTHQLSLQPSSSLVEQRLTSYVGMPGGTEQWVLQEHRDNERQPPRQQRQEQEEDE